MKIILAFNRSRCCNNWLCLCFGTAFVFVGTGLLFEFKYELLQKPLPLVWQGRQVFYAIKEKHIYAGNVSGLKEDYLSGVDIHWEHPLLGHTGADSHDLLDTLYNHNNTIALGCAITSNNATGYTWNNIPQLFPFFLNLLPSFCKTLTPGYSYHFYLAYDHADMTFTNVTLLQAFQHHFYNMTNTLCPHHANTSVKLHFVQCSHSRHPAWAQNDAMMEAYLDGMEYFFRVNDDTVLITPDWATSYIKTLSQYSPPFVGVVGPNHFGGNMGILTYDFVHRTHLDIFGLYYPRIFTDWYADDWITSVYSPNYMTKLPTVTVQHTMMKGQRYSQHGVSVEIQLDCLQKGKSLIQRYINAYGDSRQHSPKEVKKVISMSLYGDNPKYTIGAVRNAQLAPVVYPGWVLRIYTCRDLTQSQQNCTVPNRIIYALRRLGAEVVTVDMATSPHEWSHLVAGDQRVDVFIIRKADSRLSERDTAAVTDWLRTPKPFHCIRDHPKHAITPIVDSLWGARPKLLNSVLKQLILHLFTQSVNLKANKSSLLQDKLWPLVKDHAYCHDSVSCTRWPSTHKFPLRRSKDLEYLGEEFDWLGQPLATDRHFKAALQLQCIETTWSVKLMNMYQNIKRTRRGSKPTI